MATARVKEEGLVALDAAHLFATQTTRLAFKRGAWLRGFTVEFIRLFSPHTSAENLARLAAGHGEDFAI
jgi:LysR family cys regulon transcriptional activator